MKKFYLACALFALFSITIPSLYTMTPYGACKNLQNKLIINLNNIKNCSSNSSYGLNPAYLFKGIEDDKCHYSKVEIESGLKINTLAECYAPISAIQYFANDNIKATQKMCSINGISGTGYLSKEDESSLERYCK